MWLVDITAVEPLTYDIDTHGVLAAGVVHLRFENHGADPHQAQLFRLNDGVTALGMVVGVTIL